jgi:hypothetical protein
MKKLLVGLVALCAAGPALAQDQAAGGASQAGAESSKSGGASQGAGGASASATTTTASAGAFFGLVGAAVLGAVSSSNGDSSATAPTHH